MKEIQGGQTHLLPPATPPHTVCAGLHPTDEGLLHNEDSQKTVMGEKHSYHH